MSIQIYQWPEEIIALNRELATGLHPQLEAILNPLGNKVSIPEKIAHIAAYCNIEVDMVMDSEAVCNFCSLLTARLVDRRERPTNTILTLQ